MRIRVDLEAISAVSSQSAHGQNTMQDQLQTSLLRHHDSLADSLASIYQHVDQRIGTVEELLKTQSMQLEASQLNQMGHFYEQPSSYTKQPPRPARQDTQYAKPTEAEGVSLRVSQHNACDPGCLCACHLQARSATPSLVNRALGQIFVEYAGLPLLIAKCDTDLCEKAQSPHLSFEYWFPLGFVWSQIFRLCLTFEPNIGPREELNTLRRVPDSAQCVNFALNGNIDGLKDLFKRGLASPWDVSSTRGYSVLRV